VFAVEIPAKGWPCKTTYEVDQEVSLVHRLITVGGRHSEHQKRLNVWREYWADQKNNFFLAQFERINRFPGPVSEALSLPLTAWVWPAAEA
jgi:hypothetical protein